MMRNVKIMRKLITISALTVLFSTLTSPSAVQATSFDVLLINNYWGTFKGDYDSQGNGFFVEDSTKTVIRRLDSSGTLTTFVDLDIPDGTHSVSDLKVAPDNSIYIFGDVWNPSIGNTHWPYVAKFNSNGTFAWQTYWSGSQTMAHDHIAVLPDSSVVALYKTTTDIVAVKKIDSIGIDVWTSETSPSSGYGSIAADLFGNTYLTFEFGAISLNHVVVAKLNSSGVLVWDTLVNHEAVQALEFNNTKEFVQLLATDGGCGYVVSLNTSGQIVSDTLITCRTAWSWELFIDTTGSWWVAADGSSSLVGISKWTDDELVYSIMRDAYNSRFNIGNLHVNQSGDISFSIFANCNIRTSPQLCGYWQIQIGVPALPRIITMTSAYARTSSVTLSGAIDSNDLSTDVVLDVSRSIDMASAQSFAVASGFNSNNFGFNKTLDDLELGGTYYYRFRATNELGTSDSNIQTFVLPEAPSKPTISSVTRTLDSFGAQLNWQKPSANGSALESNIVEYKIGSDGTWTGATSVPISSSSSQSYNLVLTTASAGEVAYLRVKTGNAAGWSVWSDPVSIQLPSSPSSPSNISAFQVGSEIRISWDRPSNWQAADSITYSFEATTNGLTWIPITMATLPTQTTAVFDSGIAGSGYRFRVTATNFLGSSTVSSSSNLVSMVAPTTPPTAAPTTSPTTPPTNTPVIINAPSVVINTPSVTIDTPAVTIYAPTVSVGERLSAASIATGLGVAIPSKAKTTVAIAKSSRKFCRVSGGRVVGIKSGPCVATVTVQALKPKKGKKPKPVKKSVTVKIS